MYRFLLFLLFSYFRSDPATGDPGQNSHFWDQINILPFLFLLKLLEILRTYDPAVEIWLYHRAGCSTIIYKRPVAARSEWTKRREPATWNCWTVIVGNIPAQFKKPEVWDFSLNPPCLLT